MYSSPDYYGDRYNNSLSTKEIAELTRKELKQAFPECKFSITSDPNSINIYLMEAPFKAFDPSGDQMALTYGYIQVNQYYINDDERLSPRAKEILITAYKILISYRYDRSDMQSDYFDTNFYIHMGVGKYGKPFNIVPK